MPASELEVVQRSDPGRDPNKQVNEDAAGHQPTRFGYLLVVCDGMGGHALGQEASQLALRTILQMVDAAPPVTSPATALSNAIADAGRLVYEMGGAGPQAGRPGSTCVAALVHGEKAEIAHVGDSRAYLIRGQQIWRLTKDHSVVQQLIDLGTLTPEQAALHPEANKITRALGMKAETEVEVLEPSVSCEAGDVLVLATDGLTDLVGTEEIASVISRSTRLDAAGDELVRLANARGGHDNITVQIARVSSPAAMAAAIPQTAPTVVDSHVPLAPEKTVVDPDPNAAASAPRTTLPGAPPPGHSGPMSYALPAAPPDAGVLSASKTNPGTGTPSRSGFLVLALGFALVGIILAGVVIWWILRGPR
jgi:serine/threonine protein phosphatase PrpC